MDGMLDLLIEEKLKTPQGKKNVALYMASYLDDIAKNDSDARHKRMLQRAAMVMRSLANDISDE